MIYSTFISPDTLEGHLDTADWAVVDCRFSLDDAERGRRDYLQSHIPGAVYAHLNEDLSGPIVPGKTGRHPLPEIETFCQTLGRWGIGPGVQVVVYDDSGGAMAARLWWMLRWLGHNAVAVLDGGWPRWQREGRPVKGGNESRPEREFTPIRQDGVVVDAEQVEAIREDPEWLLLDSPQVNGIEAKMRRLTLSPVTSLAPFRHHMPITSMKMIQFTVQKRSAPVLRHLWPGHRQKGPSFIVGQAFRPLKTCWLWLMPGSPDLSYTLVPGASGSPIPAGRSRWGRIEKSRS